MPSCKIHTSKCHIPSKECRYINYSSPDALGDSDGNETRDKPACSTEEEGIMEEERGSGGSNVALGQHSTAGRYRRNKSTSAFSDLDMHGMKGVLHCFIYLNDEPYVYSHRKF